MRKFALVVAAVLFGSTTAKGMYMPLDIAEIPLARLTRNLQRAMKDEPRSVQWVLNLARAHAMAWSKRSDSVPAIVSEGPIMMRPPGEPAPPRRPVEPTAVWFGHEPKFVPFEPVVAVSNSARLRKARLHLDTALALYQSALTLDAANHVARLGRAWLLTHTQDTTLAISELRAVLDASSRPASGNLRLSAEAAGYLIPLLNATRDASELNVLRGIIETERRQPRAVTPIAIPLRDDLRAVDIEHRNASVRFDADGSGLPRRWTWIRPNAAWLVYDPKRTGRVTSALQMFGSVSFWMFWKDGYAALSSLDDNRDGQLTQRELLGLSLWRDANANGISEAGEVRPVREYGIVALSCRSERDTRHADRITYSPAGVSYRDGTTRPTYDLVLHQQDRVVAAKR